MKNVNKELDYYVQMFKLVALEINVAEVALRGFARTEKGIFEVVFENNEGMISNKGKDRLYARLGGKEIQAPKIILCLCKHYFNLK